MFNQFNALFQSKTILVHQLSTECGKLLKLILTHFLSAKIDLKINSSDKKISIDKINLRPECNRFLQTNIADSNTQMTIPQNCREFYKTAA